MTFSDEPSRVAQIVSRLFAGSSKSVVGDGFAADAVIGPGDDSAMFRLTGDVELVVSTDYVRGPKFTLFELGHLSLYDLGYYVAVANLSDVAAMGAAPLGIVTIVRYPPDMTDDEFESVLRGIRDATDAHHTTNIGGDIGGAERLILAATALGVAPAGGTITRSGARPGDLVAVTGSVGVAGAAVLYFSELHAGGTFAAQEVQEKLLASWRRPRARFDIASTLRSLGATSCQDVSDGLKLTLEQLAQTSGVGMAIDAAQVAVDPNVAVVADLLGVDALALAFSASVDFQLVFTFPASERASVEALAALGVAVIGEVTDGSDVVLVDASGRRPLPGVSWRHQAGPIGAAIGAHLRGEGTR